MKPKQIFIIPKQGLKVIDPLTRTPIASEGQNVEKTVYWQRRILSGDVVQGSEELAKVETETKLESIEDKQIEHVGGDE